VGEIKKEDKEGQFKDDRASHEYQEHVNMMCSSATADMKSILGTVNLPYKFREVYKSHIFTTIHLTPDP